LSVYKEEEMTAKFSLSFSLSFLIAEDQKNEKNSFFRILFSSKQKKGEWEGDAWLDFSSAR